MISAGQKVNKLMQDFFTAYFNERDYKAAAVPEIAVRL